MVLNRSNFKNTIFFDMHLVFVSSNIISTMLVLNPARRIGGKRIEKGFIIIRPRSEDGQNEGQELQVIHTLRLYALEC